MRPAKRLPLSAYKGIGLTCMWMYPVRDPSRSMQKHDDRLQIQLRGMAVEEIDREVQMWKWHPPEEPRQFIASKQERLSYRAVAEVQVLAQRLC